MTERSYDTDIPISTRPDGNWLGSSPANATGGAENWNEYVQQAGEAISQNWFQFVSDRLAKDAAFPQQLAACQTADDVYVAYSGFWQQAARDYAVEFNSFADRVWWATLRPPEASISGR